MHERDDIQGRREPKRLENTDEICRELHRGGGVRDIFCLFAVGKMRGADSEPVDSMLNKKLEPGALVLISING